MHPPFNMVTVKDSGPKNRGIIAMVGLYPIIELKNPHIMTDCVVHLDKFVIDPEYTIQPRAAPCILGA